MVAWSGIIDEPGVTVALGVADGVTVGVTVGTGVADPERDESPPAFVFVVHPLTINGIKSKHNTSKNFKFIFTIFPPN